MAWLAVNSDGIEQIFEEKPFREGYGDYLCYWCCDDEYNHVYLPEGSIKKLIGRDLFWKDEPVELDEE